MNSVELIKELAFCRKLAEKLEESAKRVPLYDRCIREGKTQICADIIRLRRELNNVRQEVERS